MADKPKADKIIEDMLTAAVLYEYSVVYEIDSDDDEDESELTDVGTSRDFTEAQDLARGHATSLSKGAIAEMIEHEKLDVNMPFSGLIQGIYDEEDTKGYFAGQLIWAIKENYNPNLHWEAAMSADEDLEQLFDNVFIEAEFGNGRYRITRIPQ
jgi:hypothetical protein